MNRLLVSPNPHLHAPVSTMSLMRDVVIALMPAVIVSVIFYGLGEIVVLATSVLSCVLLEYLITRFLLKKPNTICDWSAAVTGLLLALNLPSTTPWWVVFIGSLFAIGDIRRPGPEPFQPGNRRPCIPACLIPGLHDELGDSGRPLRS